MKLAVLPVLIALTFGCVVVAGLATVLPHFYPPVCAPIGGGCSTRTAP